MSGSSPFRKYTAAFVAIAMLGSSAAAAAPTAAPRMVDPLAVVSVFGTADSRAAICAAGASAAAAAATSAAAAAQAPGSAGCVLPVVDAPAPPGAEAAPTAIAPIPPAASNVGALPFLLGLASIVGIAAIIRASSDDDDGEIDLPISP